MPTGYTAPLHDGDPITFEQFVLRCSRAMGAAIHQRDEDSDAQITEMTVPDYYAANVDKAERALIEALSRSSQDWHEMQEQEVQQALTYKHEYVEKRAAMRDRYETMLAAVEQWTPPTKEHNGLKEFMAEQLNTSINFDCGGSYVPSVPERVPVSEYRDRKIADLSKSLTSEIERFEKERERVRSQNEWVRALRESLKEEA